MRKRANGALKPEAIPDAVGIGTLAIAIFFGALTGSFTLLGSLVAFTLGAMAYTRFRP